MSRNEQQEKNSENLILFNGANESKEKKNSISLVQCNCQ